MVPRLISPQFNYSNSYHKLPYIIEAEDADTDIEVDWDSEPSSNEHMDQGFLGSPNGQSNNFIDQKIKSHFKTKSRLKSHLKMPPLAFHLLKNKKFKLLLKSHQNSLQR